MASMAAPAGNPAECERERSGIPDECKNAVVRRLKIHSCCQHTPRMMQNDSLQCSCISKSVYDATMHQSLVGLSVWDGHGQGHGHGHGIMNDSFQPQKGNRFY
jgi:hypothetical protein